MANKFVFVSYARTDAKMVLPIVEAVQQEYRNRALGVDVWVDTARLNPGEQWAVVITKALSESVGLLVFISSASIRSEWVSEELTAAAAHLDRLIIPVILRHVPELPPVLAQRQWIDLSHRRSRSDLAHAVKQIADATEAHLRTEQVPPPVTPAKAPEIAAHIAQQVRGVRPAAGRKTKPPDSVFLVHGHDTASLSETEAYLTTIGVKSVILSRVEGPVQSLLQKFFTSAADARFAIVILSADDLGASRIQYEADGVGGLALQFRARQNVILELGFFYGLLGWENVFVLYRPPEKVYPNFERPSDIDGAVFDHMDSTGAWRQSLARKLAEAGFRLTSH